jgi:hypothetical protein
MDGGRPGMGPAFEGGGEDVRFQFGYRETRRPIPEAGDGRVAAGRCRKGHEAAGMEETAGGVEVAPDVEAAFEAAARRAC